MTILGIDPGSRGALALLDAAGHLLEIEDAPILRDGPKGRPTLNAPLLAAIVRRWNPDAAFVELVTSRPTDGHTGAFAFGRCRGAIEGVLAACGIPTTMLAVPTWRKTLALPVSNSKDAARSEAIRRWPEKAEWFARIRDDGRAEAALIGLAGLTRQISSAKPRLRLEDVAHPPSPTP